MFNMINARKVEDELNVFNGLFDSHVFWVIWVLIAAFQVRRRAGGGSTCRQMGKWGPAARVCCSAEQSRRSLLHLQ